MNQLKLAYKVAQTQIGTMELSGEQANKRIVDYHSATTLKATSDEVHWCSSFVNWCYIVSGILINPYRLTEKLLLNNYSTYEINTFRNHAVECNKFLLKSTEQQIMDNFNSNIDVYLPTRSALARSWLTFGNKITEPIEGDIVIFERGNDGLSGHVGFYISRSLGKVKVLGGNQDNKVSIKDYNSFKVLGYRR